MKINKMRNEIFQESKSFASKNGWNNNIFKDISKKMNLNYFEIRALFPDGYTTLVNMYLNEINQQMIKESHNIDLIRLRVHERVKELIILRLKIMSKDKRLLSKTFSYLMLPSNYKLASMNLFKTVDEIWYLTGDTSSDFNYYTKRLILSKVYTITLIHFINNTNIEDTIVVLNKQLAKVSKIPKIKEKIMNLKKFSPHIFKIVKGFSFIKQ